MKSLPLLLGVLTVGLFGCEQTQSTRSTSQAAQAMPPAPAAYALQRPNESEDRAQPMAHQCLPALCDQFFEEHADS